VPRAQHTAEHTPGRHARAGVRAAAGARAGGAGRPRLDRIEPDVTCGRTGAAAAKLAFMVFKLLAVIMSLDIQD
jgi:hypothetical protein